MFLRLLLERCSCALVLAILSPAMTLEAALGQSMLPVRPQTSEMASLSPLFDAPRQGNAVATDGASGSYPYLLSSLNGGTLYSNANPPLAPDPSWDGATLPPTPQSDAAESLPAAETWIASPVEQSPYVDADIYVTDPQYSRRSWFEEYPSHDAWYWQMLPDGLIYRSYWAGVHEPRTSVVLLTERDGRSLWDATLGGRFGLLRYGDSNALRPQGWQLDVEAAALARLTLDDMRDMETVDYRGGVPLTYGIGNWQFKLAYYHLSSHLADEFAISHPGSLADRVNYVRDAIVLGASYYPNPAWRLYAEAGYAFNADGGAEPWEFQFGTEYSRPGVTGFYGTPFVALNGHLREENDFSGDVNAQAGWLWRGKSGQTLRIGAQYFNGKSSQYQTFNDSEEQVGLGLWYDF